jgi:16S rRNA G527 N7-methylase RsmG
MCRAVTQLIEFYSWIAKNLKPDSEVICLKGGNLTEEINTFRKQYKSKKVKEFTLSSLYNLPFFETKKLILVQ